MNNYKKIFPICTTILIIFSTIGTLSSPANADMNGNTTVNYKGEVYPANWSLSVPGNISLGENNSYPDCLQADAKIAIVGEDNTYFEDSNKDHLFKISGTFITSKNGKYYYQNKADVSKQVEGQYRIFAQGSARKDWGTVGGIYPSSIEDLMNIYINSYRDRNVLPFLIVQFEADKDKLEAANINGAGLDTAISWTASEIK